MFFFLESHLQESDNTKIHIHFSLLSSKHASFLTSLLELQFWPKNSVLEHKLKILFCLCVFFKVCVFHFQCLTNRSRHAIISWNKGVDFALLIAHSCFYLLASRLPKYWIKWPAKKTYYKPFCTKSSLSTGMVQKYPTSLELS